MIMEGRPFSAFWAKTGITQQIGEAAEIASARGLELGGDFLGFGGEVGVARGEAGGDVGRVVAFGEGDGHEGGLFEGARGGVFAEEEGHDGLGHSLFRVIEFKYLSD